VSERIDSDDERLIARVLLRGLVHIARGDIESAEASVGASRTGSDLEDPESIRRLRISIRRIEYQITTMSDIDRSLRIDSLTEQLHLVGEPFGELRDTQIIAERVAKALGDRATSREGKHLLETIAKERDRAQRSSDGALSSGEVRAVVHALDAFRKTLPTDAITPAMARPVAQEAVRETWRSAKRAAKAAKKTGGDDQLHQLRRTIKRSVFSTRGFSYVLGPPAEEFAARLVVVQKALGRQHDRVITSEWLRSVGDNHDPLNLLAYDVSREERRRADSDGNDWVRPWAAVRELNPKESVMTTYSFFD